MTSREMDNRPNRANWLQPRSDVRRPRRRAGVRPTPTARVVRARASARGAPHADLRIRIVGVLARASKVPPCRLVCRRALPFVLQSKAETREGAKANLCFQRHLKGSAPTRGTTTRNNQSSTPNHHQTWYLISLPATPEKQLSTLPSPLPAPTGIRHKP